MPQSQNQGIGAPPKAWWIAIFRDVQFWVPVVVLLIGLLLLRIAQ